MTEEDKMWLEAMKDKGHMPALDEEGDLDVFYVEYEHHNGPGCRACHWSCCMHCDTIEDIPQCTAIELKANSDDKTDSPFRQISSG